MMAAVAEQAGDTTMGDPKRVSAKERRELARWRDERALELRVTQGRSLREIANELGITYEGARQCVNRELKRRGLRLTYAIMPAPRAEGRDELQLEAVG